MELDDWQKEVLETEGNIVLRSGRQVGKSTIISIKAGEYALANPNKSIMIIASVERQAYLLLEKTLSYLLEVDKKAIKGGKDRPTKHEIKLKNKSIIRCLPTGQSGYGIRGFTVDLLICDEAAFINEDVWQAVTPMLAVTRGKMILLSTPNVKDGFFYRCFSDSTFKTFHISSEECPRRDEAFLLAEKSRMTKAEYAREYLGEFADEQMQFFKDELIKRAMGLKRPDAIKSVPYYLGVDLARMGKDESTFEILERRNDKLYQVENKVTKRTHLNESTDYILELDKLYSFVNIYIDDGGLGSGVFDYLLKHEQTRRKVIPINNARRSLDRNNRSKKRLLKEDLYNNLLRLMEQNKIFLLDDDEIFVSLKSVHYEYTDDGDMVISGSYTHITEGLIRAAWCVSERNKNFWVVGI